MNIERLHQIMDERKLSYYKLANLIGCSTSYLTNIKNGKIKDPSFKIVCKIADVLNVDVNLFRKEHKNENKTN